MAQAVDGLTQALNTFNKVIDLVLQEPRGPKRWRMAHDLLWLNVSQKNKKIYAEVSKENKVLRDSVDKIGVSKKAAEKIGRYGYSSDNTLRQALNFPVGAYNAINKADPDAFTNKANAEKMFKTFPEYTTRELF